MNSKKRIEILITGTPGVGKSTLVGALMGWPLAETRHPLPRTQSQNGTVYETTAVEGVECVIWDLPGFVDSSGKEEKYLAEIKEKCSTVSIVVYCIDISATRSSGLTAAEVAHNDRFALRKLTTTFGSNWWKRSIFVMTRANVLESALQVKSDVQKRFHDRLQDWKERIHATLIETGVPKQIAYSIPVEPAGHKKKSSLPSRNNWLSSLWRVILTFAMPPSTNGNKEITREHTQVGENTDNMISMASEVELGVTDGFQVDTTVDGGSRRSVGLFTGLHSIENSTCCNIM